MIQSNNAWQSYRKISIQTASRGHLVLMLYDGSISFLEKALTGFEYKDPAQFHQTISNNIIRAQTIIREMNFRLDMERGEDVAENLRKLYNYFNQRLQQANFKKKREPIEEVLGHIREIRDGWAEMLAKGGATAMSEAEADRLQPA